jgi:hypothetical protein
MQPQPQDQVEEKQSAKQRGGGGSLFDGIEGIPATAETIKRYKKAACPTPKVKRKSTASVRFNF